MSFSPLKITDAEESYNRLKQYVEENSRRLQERDEELKKATEQILKLSTNVDVLPDDILITPEHGILRELVKSSPTAIMDKGYILYFTYHRKQLAFYRGSKYDTYCGLMSEKSSLFMYNTLSVDHRIDSAFEFEFKLTILKHSEETVKKLMKHMKIELSK